MYKKNFAKSIVLTLFYIYFLYWNTYIRINVWFSPIRFILNYDILNLFIINLICECSSKNSFIVKFKQITIMTIFSYVLFIILLFIL